MELTAKQQLIVAGINASYGSYREHEKKACMEYIDTHIDEIYDLFDHLDEGVLLILFRRHKEDIKEWLFSKIKSKEYNHNE